MLSILAGHSYFLIFDRKQRERAKPYPPLATLQVAAGLRLAGHSVVVFDAMLADGVHDYERELRRVRPQLALFYEDNYNFLSKMCLGAMREAACAMIAAARRAGARVIVAGSDASDAPEAYLAAGAELVLIGEGLATLRALVDRLDANSTVATADWIDGLIGVASTVKGKVVHSRFGIHPPDPRPPPLAAWDLIDIERYRSVWRAAHGHFSLNMAASRGCSFRCNWCSKPIWGNRYLQRDAGEVAAEMAHLKRVFAVEHVWFSDDIFGLRVDWVNEFAQAVRAADGAVPFVIQTRADLVTEAMARALQEAQCVEAWIGAESGSQRILDAMNKGTTVAELATARRRLAAAGIRVGFFIQLGYLGEQLDDLLATRALIEDLQPDDVGVSVSYPLPGTKFYDMVKAQLQSKSHWQESNDLEMMFEGTYRSDFYRAVRDLLHGQVEIKSLDAAARRDAQLRVDRQWEALLANERQYRSDPVEASA
jgi:anaerobic magnesium-protoporphyrin IX monomethyl ester cyclase